MTLTESLHNMSNGYSILKSLQSSPKYLLQFFSTKIQSKIMYHIRLYLLDLL